LNSSLPLSCTGARSDLLFRKELFGIIMLTEIGFPCNNVNANDDGTMCSFFIFYMDWCERPELSGSTISTAPHASSGVSRATA